MGEWGFSARYRRFGGAYGYLRNHVGRSRPRKRGGKIGRQREGKAGTGKEQPPDYFMSDRLGGLFDRHAGFCLSEA